MRHVILDREGKHPARTGYVIIASETEFVRKATEPILAQVRSNLCGWAEAYCRGRNISFDEIVSPKDELRNLFPAIQNVEIESLLEHVGPETFENISRPLSAEKLLTAISKTNLWTSPPSETHAADWLLWLLENNPETYLQPLLRVVSKKWLDGSPAKYHSVYQVLTATDAKKALIGWTGVELNPEYEEYGSFPRSIPSNIKSETHEIWRKQIVDTQAVCVVNGLKSTVHAEIKRIIAQEAYLHLKRRTGDLSARLLVALAPYLTWQEQKVLRDALPPDTVAILPTDPNSVLEWFTDSYMPFRLWQQGKDLADAKILLNEKARDFSLWYLKNYPEALSSGKLSNLINFSKLVQYIRHTAEYVILVIVLDGLHYGDARDLYIKLKDLAPRLNMATDEVVFTAIPTVTEFCKTSLFHGVRPDQCSQVEPIGQIIPESESPISRLSSAQPGNVYLWRVQEPDRTYHSWEKHDSILRKVQAELDAVAKMIADIVEDVPDEIPLQVLVTTDHGRLLETSAKRLQHPANMNVHGRVAWGQLDFSFQNQDFVIDGECAILQGERYGMESDLVIPLSQDAFVSSDGKGGKLSFTHGGLYPEEVIIPWAVFVRDYVTPKITVQISGNAQSGKPGRLRLGVINYADIAVILKSCQLILPAGQSLNIDEINKTVAAREIAFTHEIPVSTWPTSSETKGASCVCQFQQPNGLTFSVEGVADIGSQSMYQKTNPLEDLL